MLGVAHHSVLGGRSLMGPGAHRFACSPTASFWLFAALWTAALQAPLSMGFSQQEYALPFLFQGIFPAQGLNPRLLRLLHCGQIPYC